jgi:hypothetical protein
MFVKALQGLRTRRVRRERNVGVLQINLKARASELAALVLDSVHSKAANIAYGKLLYAREGLRPWFTSKKCWSGAIGFMPALSGKK